MTNSVNLDAQRERLLAEARHNDHVAEALRVFNTAQRLVPVPRPAPRVSSVRYSTAS